MNIRPLHDRLIVRRTEEERKTAGGIVLPDSATEKPNHGEVLAVGNGKRNSKGDIIPMEVKVGDKVMFGQYAGTKIKHEGEELLVLSEDDIMAIIE